MDSAFQGEEALLLARTARQQGRPYALAFVDIRMPPGIDGVETTSRLWKEDPDIQVVICSAYADYSWEEMMQRLGLSQRLLILRKPFDGIEVRQLAFALTEKWELLRSNRLHMEDLARAVDERTRQLTAANARLMQAQRLEALGRLSAGLAHEINNPLSFILANLSYLRTHAGGGPVTPEPPARCRSCARYAPSPSRAPSASAASSRTSSCSAAWTRRLAPASTCTRCSITRWARPASCWRPTSRWCATSTTLPAGLRQRERACSRCSSACWPTPRRPSRRAPPLPTLRVSTHLQEDGRVAVEVQDNGKGIAPEHLERVFEPFFTTKRMGTTTGLGLSVCYGIILGLGGDITVDCSLGQGATFRVLLPQVPASG